jgi:hypothetical protein
MVMGFVNHSWFMPFLVVQRLVKSHSGSFCFFPLRMPASYNQLQRL